jgi:hypothetical protein
MRFFLFFGLIILTSCEDFGKIEKGDIVKHCIIDTVFVTQSPSTIEPGNRYHYRTDCGQVLTTRRNDVYKIGDTITYVYKKKK